MTNRQAMLALQKIMTSGDNDMKRQLTAAQVNRIFKNLSMLLFNTGTHAWLENEGVKGVNPNFVSHDLIAAAFLNGKRLSKRKK